MRYLGLALYAEGATDYRFLSPLLLRLCEDICLRHASQPVDVSGVLALDDRPGMRKMPREERIADAALDADGSWDVLFVHSDGEGDPARAVRERIAPALTRLRNTGLLHAEGVAVVPVRETEAWVLTDGDALRAVFGVSLDDAALGLPAPGAVVESVANPKKRLDLAFAATRPGGRRARAGAAPLLNALGERVSLPQLRAVPSFRAVENDLIAALRRLGLL